VIIAINPARQLATVRNTERKSDLKQIYNAMTQYYIDNGEYPATIPTTLTEICDTGTATTSLTCGSLINLTALVPTYITAIPTDPSGASSTLTLITPAYAAIGGTGYKLGLSSSTNGKLIATAPLAEVGEFIALGTTLASSTPPITYYTVTYNGNGSDGGTPPPTHLEQAGVTITVRDNTSGLTKNEASFGGWNTAANGSGTNYFPDDTFLMPESNITLYAIWYYTVSYDGNGNDGGDTPPGVSLIAGANYPVMGNINSLTKTGYSFVNWNTEAGGTGTSYSSGDSFILSPGDVVLYAQWASDSYTITFDSNGGSAVSPITQNYGTSITPPANPTRIDYTFSGWSPTIPATMPALSQTITAQWTLNPCDSTCLALRSGLLVYYPLDTNINDYSGNNHNGTFFNTGTPLNSSSYGKVGGGYYFDKTYGVSMNSKIGGGASQLSACTWYNIRGDGSGAGGNYQQQLVGLYGGINNQDYSWALFGVTDLSDLRPNATTRLADSSWPTVFGSSVAKTNWTHICMTFGQGTYLKLYQNGTEISSVAVSNSANWGGPTSADATIGLDVSNSAYRRANAYIDEVSVWGRVLSSTEVSQLYNSGTGRSLIGN